MRHEGLRLIEDMEMDDVADLKVLPGARALLESLPPERWAIVTSATDRLLLGRLKAAELPVPERMISGDMVERGKPDPEPYRRGAELIQSHRSGVPGGGGCAERRWRGHRCGLPRAGRAGDAQRGRSCAQREPAGSCGRSKDVSAQTTAATV